MDKTTLSVMLHGFSGHRKSWTAATAPSPVLVLDVEGRARYLPYPNKVWWDPQEGPPPAAGDWTHCIVNVTKFTTLDLAKQWLESGQHCFRSVDLDSLMFAQKRFIDDLRGIEQMRDYDWGTVLRNLEVLVRDLTDLRLLPTNTVEVVVVVVGTKETESGRLIPMLQGQLKDTVPYMFDAVGYMYLGQDNDGNATGNMLTQPTDKIVAKDGTDMLGGPVIVNPNLTAIWNTIRERTQS